MNNCCHCNGEIMRDGSGRLGRYLKALDPAYAPVDDRSIEELLVFTKKYANQIRFYDVSGGDNGNGQNIVTSWREFFRRDIAVIVASVAMTDLAQIRKDYDELRVKLDARPVYGVYKDLFDPVIGMAVKIDKWYSISIPGNALYNDLVLAINSNLGAQIQKVKAYEEGFKYVDAKHPLEIDYSAIENKDLWGLNDIINADISIYEGQGAEEKILAAALSVDDIFNNFYSFIVKLVDSCEKYMQLALEQYPSHQPHMALFIAFLQLFRLVQEQMNGITGRMLDFYYRDVLQLSAKPSIPDKVHIVFELAKDVLEYDVAKATTLKAGKDLAGKEQVYKTTEDIVVNQAKIKEIKNIFISNTIGPDNSKTIKAVYARPVANSRDGFGEKFTAAGASWPAFGKGNVPVTNTTGLCAQINNNNNNDDSGREDLAEIGFGIASPQLFLQGGNRLIKLQFAKGNTDALLKAAKAFETKETGKNFFNISLTGDKGWINIQRRLTAEEWNKMLVKYTLDNGETGTLDIFNPSFQLGTSAYYLDDSSRSVIVFLPIAEQAVAGFDAKLHPGYNFKTGVPVMKVAIDLAITMAEATYKNILFSSLSLQVNVGSVNPSPDLQKNIQGFSNTDISKDELFNFHYDGLKSLIIQNENGLVQKGKPFDPFTAYPAQGKSFYIGSTEVFNKPFNAKLQDQAIPGENDLDKLAVNIRKTRKPDFNNSSADYGVNVLRNRNWILLNGQNAGNFSQADLSSNILQRAVSIAGVESVSSIPVPLPRKPLENFSEWNTDSNKGFLEISYLIETPDDLQGRQNRAISLEIKEISVSYRSTLDSLEPGIEHFYHLYPFGVVETYINQANLQNGTPFNSAGADFKVLNALLNGLLVNAGNMLFPQFNYISPYAQYYQEHPAPVETREPGEGNGPVDVIGLLVPAEANSGNVVQPGAKPFTDPLLASFINPGLDGNSLANQYTGDMQEGMLFIGIEKLQPQQSVSLLFQFAEGSAGNEDDDPPVINWSYLTGNEWRPFKAENITSDGTYGFQATGIIKIDVPADASVNSTIISDGLVWFCASVTENADRIPQLVSIVTQAVEAVFVDNGNDQTHFDKALAAESINKLDKPVAQITRVQQPFASFDGKHKEIGKEFYTRVSERLRHKGRAVNAWDFEHLILDRFPGIYKVKCITHSDPRCLCRNTYLSARQTVLPISISFPGNGLPRASVEAVVEFLQDNPAISISLVGHGNTAGANVASVFNILTGISPLTPPLATPVHPRRISGATVSSERIDNVDTVNIVQTEECCSPQIAPGHVLIIPVADLKNRNAANLLQPKTSRRTLIAIEKYLQTRTSPFVHVHAKNPLYEEVIVSFKVKFYLGIDKGYYMKVLNNELVRYLTPWAFDENADISFNQKIYASSIINFIEERSYVDFITDFVMGVCCNSCCDDNEGVGYGSITGKVYDNEQNKRPLAAVLIKIKELSLQATTGADGSYSIDNIPAGSYTLIAYFSLFNIAKQEFALDIPGPKLIAAQDFFRGAGNRQENIAEFFNQFCGCDSVEKFLQDDPAFDGDIVAKPCTSRSILVSVPQHIIIPYEEDDKPSDCASRRTASALRRTALPKPLIIAKEITAKPAAKTSANKKAAKKTESPTVEEKNIKSKRAVKKNK